MRQVQTLDPSVVGATGCCFPGPRTVITEERDISTEPDPGRCPVEKVIAADEQLVVPAAARVWLQKEPQKHNARRNQLCDLLVTSPVVRGLPCITRDNAVQTGEKGDWEKAAVNRTEQRDGVGGGKDVVDRAWGLWL